MAHRWGCGCDHLFPAAPTVAQHPKQDFPPGLNPLLPLAGVFAEQLEPGYCLLHYGGSQVGEIYHFAG